MGRSKLRQIRRLKAYAAPLIAERNRRQKEREDSLPSEAENHLLRVVLVFRFGEPRMDEPLALAYGRALSKLKSGRAELFKKLDTIGRIVDNAVELLLLHDLRRILESEPPVEELKSKISTWVLQMPEWLRLLCWTNFSMRLLGLDYPPLSQDVLKLTCAKSDRHAWPLLPQGILEPRPDHGNQFEMSLEEITTYLRIIKKPQEQRTRREHRFCKYIRSLTCH